jgi:hypothetical protein
MHRSTEADQMGVLKDNVEASEERKQKADGLKDCISAKRHGNHESDGKRRKKSL